VTRLQRWLEKRLGVAGVVGVALIAGSAAFYYAGLLPAASQRAVLRAELEREAHGLRLARSLGGGDRLGAFYGSFGSREGAPAALRSVFEAAAAEGLAIETGEYRLAGEPGSRLVRYQMVLPVKGSYVAIRRFIVRALNEVPGLALDGLDIRRESVASRAVEARLQLTLYLGAT
jgi:hypothetical protein